jgi:hypothetical protein
MMMVLPENGYESPLPSPHGGDEYFGRHRHITPERRRVALTGDANTAPAPGDGGEAQAYIINGGSGGSEQVEEKKPRTVGFRDRVGCYTWTWFTMNMATGGIANVLHSSRIPHLPPPSSV